MTHFSPQNRLSGQTPEPKKAKDYRISLQITYAIWHSHTIRISVCF